MNFLCILSLKCFSVQQPNERFLNSMFSQKKFLAWFWNQKVTEGFAVRVYMEVGKMGLTLEEIIKKKKRYIFHQDKKCLWRGTWNGCICWLSLQNTWKEVREMNEKRQGGTRTAWMQPSAQEVHDWQVSKRQGRVGKYKKDVEYWLFSIFLAFLPSHDSTGFWSRRSFCPSQSEILYIPTLSRDWHINKQGPSTTIKANYVQRQFVAERWSWKIYLNSHQNKNEFRGCIC